MASTDAPSADSLEPDSPDDIPVITLPVRRRTLMHVLWAGIGFLVAMGAYTGFFPREPTDEQVLWHIHRLFFLDLDKSVPTWASSVALFMAALFAMSIAGRRTRLGLRFARHWWVLGFGFTLMSVDEATELHEYTGLPGASDKFTFDWLSFGIPLVIIVAIAFMPFLRALPAHLRKALLAAGAIYLSGAIGAEIAATALVDNGLGDSNWYQLEVVVEEGLEMVGIALLIRALLAYGNIAAEAQYGAKSKT